MASEITQLAAAVTLRLTRASEGCVLRPYLDSVCVPTIGYGATYYEDGRKVSLKDAPISLERAEALLLWHVTNVYLPAAVRLCPGAADSPNRLGAIADFAFNLGVARLSTSTMRKRVNERNWIASASECRKWDKAGGRVLRGLTRRREKEALLLVAGG